ncbi:MAG: hypothetical protein OEY28_08130 [Nitrospira sp.]|nr:hypothetical protein [Nitrospira sp.]
MNEFLRGLGSKLVVPVTLLLVVATLVVLVSDGLAVTSRGEGYQIVANKTCSTAYDSAYDLQSSFSPDGTKESVWEDYSEDDLDEAARVELRPGTYVLVDALADVLDGLYAIEPVFPHMTFPFNNNGKLWETEEEMKTVLAEKENEARKNGRKLKNKLRQYNVDVHSLEFLEFGKGDDVIENPESIGFSERMMERFKEVRSNHPERAVLVCATCTLKSLQSEKVEGSADEPGFYFCFVRKERDWKLCWYEK